jgi:iron-sulfur cluster repair protein YtfE (RIC family)
MSASTVTQYLKDDHRRLDALIDEVGARLKERAFADAGRRFAEFAAGLHRHIEIEERILFPVYEERTQITQGPTQVMRFEHREIRRLMDAIAAALKEENAPHATEGLGALVEILTGHNRKEERVLYPMTDELLGSAGARAALVRDMEAV